MYQHELLISLSKDSVAIFLILLIQMSGITPEAFTLLFALMIFDTITGIGKRISLGKTDITSKKFMLGLSAKISLLVLLLFFGYTVKLITGSSETMISIVIWGFIAAELYSSIQNVYTIKTGKEVTEYDATSIILGGMLWFTKNIIEKFAETLAKK